MATRALTPLAQRQSRARVSGMESPGRERDWRQVLFSQNAEAIWNKLSVLVRSEAPDQSVGYEQLTQDLFLHLLATDRVSFYIEQDYSDSQIEQDLVSLMCG